MWQVINGNNVDVLRTFADNTFDSIVTDPPYGIDFLGKAWDANTGALATYQECLRVLKPGGHILAFSAARTYHHLAVTLEQAGFEIRDQIMWIYSSGFPKSQDIGRSIQRTLGVKETKKNLNARSTAGDSLYDSGHQKTTPGQDVVCTDPEAKVWEGWGTSLKPAHEPICLARKPLHKNLSIARNCQQWGVGALNIDATRVPYESATDIETYLDNKRGPMERAKIEDGAQIGMFEGKVGYKAIKRELDPEVDLPAGRFPSNVIGEIPDYQKYFYCPKVSRAERHIGYDLSQVPVNEFNDPAKVKEHPLWDESMGTSISRLQDKIRKSSSNGNTHPTVKPIELMKYLIRLVTPAGGHVLDPFNGSGSTGCAAAELDYDYTGIELDANYVDIARKRIQAWHDQTHNNKFAELFE
jgi:DNA modification methylase